MKRASIWAGLTGGLITAISLLVVASIISSPADIALVNIARIVESLLFAGLGVFLVAIFLRLKHKEDAGLAAVRPEPNSPADIESLTKKRNWILGSVLLVSLILQVEDLIFNNYRAGFTPIKAV